MKRRTNRAAICLAALLILTAALTAAAKDRQESEVVIKPVRLVAESNINANGRFVFDATYPKLSGLGDRKAQKALNKYFKDQATGLLAQVKQAGSDLVEAGSSATAEGIYSYSVKRNSGGIVSILESSYLYSGGANGTERVHGVNIISQSGETLSLCDLFPDCEKALEAINQMVASQLYHRGLEEQLIVENPRVTAEQEFYLTDLSLVIVVPELTWFNHATGTIEFTIPFKDLQSPHLENK